MGGWVPRFREVAALGIVAVVVAWVFGCAPSGKPESGERRPPRAQDEIEAIVESRGDGLGLSDTTAIAKTWSQLTEFYEQRHYRPIWSHGRRLRHQAQQLLDALQHTEEAGLDPRDYDLERLTRLSLQSRRNNPPALLLRHRTLVRFDVLATYAYLRAAGHLRDGRVPHRVLDADWGRDSLSADGLEALRKSLGRDPSELFAELEPKHDGYRRLREALVRYRGIDAQGGWDPIPPGLPLSIGSRGPRVAALVRRLASTGEFRPGPMDTVFDRRLELAVGDLQTRLGIPRSGVLGEATRAALNVPIGARIRQMELNLERWRWLPDSLGRRHVEINIPAYRLELVRDGRVTRAMRVVVGRRRSPTPVFSDRITYLELNPPWRLPPSVVQKEIAPALKRQHDFLEVNHMRVISIANAKPDTVDPRHVPWKDVASDSFPYLVVQDAGPDNPLGRIKLMCPNEYDVYLHDSPLRSRFSVAVRDYSHGCVRLEHAIELADSLIGVAPGDSVGLDSLVAKGTWRRLRLREPIPVHFLYWTAWADSAGLLHFRDDIYGLDQRLDDALRARATSGLALNPGVELSPFWMAAQAKLEAAARGTRSRAPKH
jgi:murein L,D-transpeptidase YcbB/YkuD